MPSPAVRRILFGPTMPSTSFFAAFSDNGAGVANITAIANGSGAGTFTRATASRALLSSGLYGDVASGSPCSMYSPGGIYLGYLSFELRSNKVARSDSFSADWSAIGSPSRVGANTSCGTVSLDLLGDGSGAELQGYGINVSFGSNAAKAISFLIAQGTSTSSVVRLRDTSVGADRLLCAITWSAGIPTITMTTGTLDVVDTLGNSCFRVKVLSTAVTAANTNNLQCYPATDAALSLGPTGNVNFGGLQAEDATFACAVPIQTNGAAANRNADLLTFPLSGNMSNTFGTLSATITSASLNGTTTSIVQGVSSAGAPAYLRSSAGTTNKLALYDGSAEQTLASITRPITSPTQIATSWGNAACAGYVGGAGQVTGTFDGSLNIGSSFAVGCSTDGIQVLNGCIKNLRVLIAEANATQVAGIQP